MGNFGSNAMDDDVQELIQVRREAYRVKVRQDLTSKLRAIQDRANGRIFHDLLCPDRPYGLAESMEGIREHTWEYVFEFIYDLETISNLREVCVLFRNLLERKYVAAELPEIVAILGQVKCHAQSRSNDLWFARLVNLKILSRASKATVDTILERGSFGEAIFTIRDPHQRDPGGFDQTPPFYWLGIFKDGQPHLKQHGTSFEESMYRMIVEQFGSKCISLVYRTHGDAQGTNDADIYRILGGVVSSIDNLKELIVAFMGTREKSPWSRPKVPPFPKCPGLKRYIETQMSPGLSAPYLLKVFQANPQIDEVMINDSLSWKSEVKGVIQALDTLDIRKLFCIRTPSVPFFQHRFHWASQLTAFTLWDNLTNWHQEQMNMVPDVPSHIFFAFLSTLRNLKILRVATKLVRNTGEYLDLPNLIQVTWQIQADSRSLEFLKPCESLEQLDLDLRNCPEFLKPENGHGRRRHDDVLQEDLVMDFLGEFNIPSIFPALKSVNVSFTHHDMLEFLEIWKRS